MLNALYIYPVTSVAIAIYRKLNARNILLEPGARSEVIGVRRRDGSFAYMPFGGFLERAIARALGSKARSGLLQASRAGKGSQFGMEWQDLQPGQFVLGCLFEQQAYVVHERDCVCVVEYRPVVVPVTAAENDKPGSAPTRGGR